MRFAVVTEGLGLSRRGNSRGHTSSPIQQRLPLLVGKASSRLYLLQGIRQGIWGEAAAAKQVAGEYVGPGFTIEMLRFSEKRRGVVQHVFGEPRYQSSQPRAGPGDASFGGTDF